MNISLRFARNRLWSSDVEEVLLRAMMFAADDRGMFMGYWYGTLCTVIDGWKILKLSDPAIDPLLKSPNVKLLKKFRDGVYHFQRNYFDNRFNRFFESQDSVPWVRNLTSQFGGYFLRRHGIKA